MACIDLAFSLFPKQKTWTSPVSQSSKVITNSPAEWAQKLIKHCKIIIKINNFGFKKMRIIQERARHIPAFLWIKDVRQLIHI